MTDFGLAKTLVGLDVMSTSEDLRVSEFSLCRTQLTYRGIPGTPQYMAPEQWVSGESLDARADIYASDRVL